MQDMACNKKLKQGKSCFLGWRQELLTLLTLTAGCIIQALITSSIYQPNGLVGGGVTGIALLCQYAFGIPSWIVILALNVPIMILGYRHLNLRLVLYSILATVLFTFVLAVTPHFVLPVEERLIAVLFGGVLMGAAGAPAIRFGASMGGMDVLSIMLNKRFSFSLGSINIAINIIIIGLLALVNGLEIALLSIIAMFVSNVAYNNVLQGLNRTKTVFIISDKWEEIAPLVLQRLGRGVTYIPAKGAYTGQDKTIVYCIVRTVELGAIRSIIRQHDPGALFSIIDTREVVGRGFAAMNS